VRFNAFEAPGAVDVAGEREHRGKEGVESAELLVRTSAPSSNLLKRARPTSATDAVKSDASGDADESFWT
jgi:hypothetical protein